MVFYQPPAPSLQRNGGFVVIYRYIIKAMFIVAPTLTLIKTNLLKENIEMNKRINTRFNYLTKHKKLYAQNHKLVAIFNKNLSRTISDKINISS